MGFNSVFKGLITWIKAPKMQYESVSHKSCHTLKSSGPFLLRGWSHTGGQIHLGE